MWYKQQKEIEKIMEYEDRYDVNNNKNKKQVTKQGNSYETNNERKKERKV